MWARMTKHKLLIKGNKTAPNYDQPQFIHLHEWDSWVVTYTKRRELKAHVTKLGAKWTATKRVSSRSRWSGCWLELGGKY